MQQICRLTGNVQHYDWGGKDFIPSLLGINKQNEQPFAEYWLGAHPAAPSIMHFNGEENLLKYSERFPEKVFGAVTPSADRFPYLLKILDVASMLSIQVHPDKEQAKAGFEMENRLGIPLNAKNRNFRDANHKPELMVALGRFYLLHGFREADDLLRIMPSIPGWEILSDRFKISSYRGLFEAVMYMEQKEIDHLLQPLLQRIVPLYDQGKLDKLHPDFWAARAAVTYGSEKPDRGIILIYLMQLLKLDEGEGVYQAAGVPHAYLEGKNVELMANSDNVLRGGLTTKHIDVDALLKHTRFEYLPPQIVRPVKSNNWMHYPTPASDFDLFTANPDRGEKLEFISPAPEIMIVMKGALHAETRSENLELRKGQSIFIFPGTEVKLVCSEPSQLFRASVPQS